MGHVDIRRQLASILDQVRVRTQPRQRAMEPSLAIAEFLRACGTATEAEVQELEELAVDETNRKAAPGVDEVTWAQYEGNLEANLLELHQRLCSGAYRAEPSRRVYIPKADGRQRPLGVAMHCRRSFRRSTPLRSDSTS